MIGAYWERLWPSLRMALCLGIIVFLIAPMVIVAIVSFSSAPFLTFPPPGLSLQWYRKLSSSSAWLDAIATSATIMVPSATVATAAGTAAAVGLARARIPGAGLIASLIMAPMIVPVIITAAAMLGLVRAWGLEGTRTGLILAHTTLALPYVVFTVLAAMRLVDDRLESAALTLGATRWRAFWRITFPLILPAVLSGMLFAMVISFDELVVSIFLSSPTVRPVTVQMWSDVRGDVDPTIAAIGALLLAFSVCALLLETMLNRQRLRPLIGATAPTGPRLGPRSDPGLDRAWSGPGPGSGPGSGPSSGPSSGPRSGPSSGPRSGPSSGPRSGRGAAR